MGIRSSRNCHSTTFATMHPRVTMTILRNPITRHAIQCRGREDGMSPTATHRRRRNPGAPKTTVMLGCTCQTRQVATTLRRNPQVCLWSKDQRNRVKTRTVRRLDACPGFCCGKAEKQAQGVKESMDEEEELKRRPRATGKGGHD